MADFAPYIKFSENSHYLTIPVQMAYPPSDVWGSDSRYRKVENLDYENTEYINDPLYYLPADNLAEEAEQPQDYDDWHNDCLIALRKRVNGEWVFDNKVIVFQHYTRWCNKKSNGNIHDWSMEMRVGLYDTENLTFDEWSDYIFGGGGIAREFDKVEAYITAYNIPTLAGDQLIGPSYLFKVVRNSGVKNFKVGGFVLSKKWFTDNGYDDSMFKEIDDPNEEDPDGPSGPGGGGGDHDPGSDIIPIPPTGPIEDISYANAGLVSLYRIDMSQLQQLAAELFTTTAATVVKNFFTSMFDIICGLMLLPVTPQTSGLYKPKLGTHVFNIPLALVSKQFVAVDCGTLAINEYYGSCYDYSPFSKLSIYLPWLGVRELDVDEVMGKTIGVTYHIDCFNGDFVVFVTIFDGSSPQGSIRYQFAGNCGQQVPVTAANYDAIIQNAISFATVAVSSVASAGAATAAGGAMAGALGETATITAEGASAISEAAASTANVNAAGDIASSGISAVMNSKPRIERSGSMGGSSGFMSFLRPYIIRTIPRQSLPKNYKTYNAYPSNITALLSTLSGYTIIDRINLRNIPATDGELSEIESILKGGVYL